jgi:hypothetical protein
MKFCTKCGGELSESTKFCVSCGTPVAQENNSDNSNTQEANTAASVDKTVSATLSSITQYAQKMPATTKLLCASAGMALIFLYYLINYLGPWSLTFLGFISYLLVPGLFAALIFSKAQGKGESILFIAPFALRGLTSLVNLFRSIAILSLQGWLINLSHIGLAVLFVVTVFSMYNGKRVMQVLSGAAAIVIGIMALGSSILGGLVQFIYFAAVFLLLWELDIVPSKPKI